MIWYNAHEDAMFIETQTSKVSYAASTATPVSIRMEENSIPEP